MNKNEFIDELSKVSGYDREKCVLVNDILESHFIVGRKNKEKIVNDFIEKLSFSEEEADKMYNTVMDVFAKGVKDKLLHPFADKD